MKVNTEYIYVKTDTLTWLIVGVHRATGESVAIKVIDKQRFQPKHTEALKNEANILQVRNRLVLL